MLKSVKTFLSPPFSQSQSRAGLLVEAVRSPRGSQVARHYLAHCHSSLIMHSARACSNRSHYGVKQGAIISLSKRRRALTFKLCCAHRSERDIKKS